MTTDAKRREDLLKSLEISKKGRERAAKVIDSMDTEVGLVSLESTDTLRDEVEDDIALPHVLHPHPATHLRPITAPKGFSGRPSTSLHDAMALNRPTSDAPRQNLLGKRFEDRTTMVQLKMLERRVNGHRLELGNAGVNICRMMMLSHCLRNNPQVGAPRSKKVRLKAFRGIQINLVQHEGLKRDR